MVYRFNEKKLQALLEENGYWEELLRVQGVINKLSVGPLKNVWFLGPSLYKSLKLAEHEEIAKGSTFVMAEKPQLVICSQGSLGVI